MMSFKIKVFYKIKDILDIFHFFDKWSDEKYLKLIYRIKFKEDLNLDKPITFNEKLNWLKINDRNPYYTKLADKIEVKKIVEEKVGKEYVNPTIKEYNNFDEIDFEELPNKFVLKCNHNSGGLAICTDKAKFNINKAKKDINKSLKENYYYKLREWPYKEIKPRLLIEEYIEDDTEKDLKDYKFFCFNGVPKMVYLTVKNDNIWENFYDLEFKPIDLIHGMPRYSKEFKKPENFEKMIEIATELSKNIPFVRIDLHNIKGKILFGEYTFYDWGGMMPFKDEKWDKKLGEYIKL